MLLTAVLKEFSRIKTPDVEIAHAVRASVKHSGIFLSPSGKKTDVLWTGMSLIISPYGKIPAIF